MIPVLSALLDRHLAERPNATAFIAEGRAFTYAEFDALSRRAAAWLHANGVGAGDRVALWLVNRLEWLALLFGVARIGAAAVSVNTRYRAAELEHILAHSGARMLVLQPSFRGVDFAGVLAGVDKAATRSLERVAFLDAREWPEAETPGRALQLGQHGLVAEMHAVEIAYGERGRARGRSGNAARESHTTKPGS